MHIFPRYTVAHTNLPILWKLAEFRKSETKFRANHERIVVQEKLVESKILQTFHFPTKKHYFREHKDNTVNPRVSEQKKDAQTKPTHSDFRPTLQSKRHTEGNRTPN